MLQFMGSQTRLSQTRLSDWIASCIFPAPALESANFSRNTGYFVVVAHAIRNCEQAVDVLFAPRPSQLTEQGNICMDVNPCLYKHITISMCNCLYLYQGSSCVHPDVTTSYPLLHRKNISLLICSCSLQGWENWLSLSTVHLLACSILI